MKKRAISRCRDQDVGGQEDNQADSPQKASPLSQLIQKEHTAGRQEAEPAGKANFKNDFLSEFAIHIYLPIYFIIANDLSVFLRSILG